MGREIDELASRLSERAFLYRDPESFREGIRAAVRAMNALADRRRPPVPKEGNRRSG